MVSINELSADFELPDLQGVPHKLSDYRRKIVIINFWSAECLHSERTDRSLVNLFGEWNGEVELLSIAVNRNESLQMIEEAAKVRHIPKVLIDADHAVADMYGAMTTPHVFVLDREGILRYRGAVDDVTFHRREATQFFLQEAVESLLSRRIPNLSETPAYGCTIVREI